MFANPLGLIALVAVPAVVGLHLFRRRHRHRLVSAAFLWEGADQRASAGRRREPLTTNPSFWLELLAALLLCLCLASPRGCGIGASDHVVLVLDGSASMSAVREDAIDEAGDRVRALPRSGRATIVSSGPNPRVIAGPAALEAEALSALEAWQPGLPNHELGPSIDLATELASGGAIVLISDRFEPETWPEHVGIVAVGEPGDNLGITRSSRIRATEGERLFVEVESSAAQVTSTRLRVLSGDEVLAEEPVLLESEGRSAHRFVLPEGTGSVRVVLDLEDSLQIDDEVVLAPSPVREVRLDVDVDEATASLLGLDRWADLAPRTVMSEDAHLRIVGPATTTPDPDTWLVHLGGERKQSVLGPFLIDRSHRLLDGVTLDGVIWSYSEQPPPGRALVRAGDRPLVTQEETVFHVDIDPRASTLHRSPDWPILLSNLIELRRDALPGPRETNLVVGQDFVHIGAGLGPWILDGEELEVIGEDLVVTGLDHPGLHLLEGPEERIEFAVRLADSAESDLRERSSGDREPIVETGTVASELSGLDTALLLLALLLICVDWWILSRQRS
ncbi:MAG TPA: BatA domain-containing protein [Myxococcota bacterium]|nr:BatA domain-containing protein [Myxococcota bacterium]